MANHKTINHLKIPSIHLSECVRQMEVINENVFALKMATINLIEAVEGGDLKTAKWIIESANIKQIIENLSAKE